MVLCTNLTSGTGDWVSRIIKIVKREDEDVVVGFNEGLLILWKSISFIES